jgi:hypothetical protein
MPDNDDQLDAWTSQHSAEEQAELQQLIAEQKSDDRTWRMRQDRQHNGVRADVLSLEQVTKRDGRLEAPPIDPLRKRPPTGRFKEESDGFLASVSDIEGSPSSVRRAPDRSAEVIDGRLSESRARAGDRLVYDAWNELHAIFFRGLPQGLRLRQIDSWFERFVHDDRFARALSEEDRISLVCQLLIAFCDRWPRHKVLWRLNRGETLRDVEVTAGISKSTLQRWSAEHARDEEGTRMMTQAQAERHERRLEQIELRLDNALDNIEDVCGRIRERFPNDAEVQQAVEGFLATVPART